MKVSGEWLEQSGTQSVLRMLTGAGHQAFAVGGCVRNAVLRMPVADVDIATDARPAMVMELAAKAGLRAVPTGIDHGTVTIVANGTGYEVTTFRADIETDGRHATVRFSDAVTEDARRRDFTMNALYVDSTGQLCDPLAGLADLRARRVRFIEDPDRRINEDFLRILRFFRFVAWYGDPAAGLDPQALAAIATHLDGLDNLSRERVGSEVIKLLAAPDPAPSVATMRATGVLGRVLPGAVPHALGPLIHIERQFAIAPDALRRLAVLGFADGATLRLSRADQRHLLALRDGIESADGAAALGYRHGAAFARDVLLLRAALFELPLNPAAFVASDRGATARFPVTAHDLMPELSGPALGARLKKLEDLWIASDFILDRDSLLHGS
ncbi:CCA tRNA nucleotidyltransferase [Puniceibacterium sp. IMCC21224]|uniref:CCA tRNA nucleotidyltransferase n=1 Tax=Puniceibacterium sp. IMCC21224 TaxID=1618204 RepID=UPI00064D959A|nr:CCA tRNA nucleotidyltransferase [Puniceibacterium sp. IMCC21224]KMK65434.1 tRNA nucleotidyltransferase/poly(A) polymerase [Puniceibacterium sp. IMCC21224]